MTRVSSSMPRCLRSLMRAAMGLSTDWMRFLWARSMKSWESQPPEKSWTKRTPCSTRRRARRHWRPKAVSVLFVQAVDFLDVLPVRHRYRHVGDFHLHAVGEFVVLHACGEIRVLGGALQVGLLSLCENVEVLALVVAGLPFRRGEIEDGGAFGAEVRCLGSRRGGSRSTSFPSRLGGRPFRS